jgi:virulence-associated protein VapD
MDDEKTVAIRSQEDVARIMTERGFKMSRGRVYQLEKAALEKITQDPEIRAIAAELGFLTGDIR